MNPRIKSLLESAYSDFHSHYHRERDPVSLAHLYEDPRDREVAAFFAALISYGNVQTILTNARRVLAALGPSPHAQLQADGFAGKLEGFRHRFSTGEDLEIIGHWVGTALREHGSLEKFFVAGSVAKDGAMKDLLGDFVRRLETLPLPKGLRKPREKRAASLKYLLSDPQRGSACKRLNMYLRWMVRPADGVDLGLWSAIHTKQLVLPIDTHLLQTLQALRWTTSKGATWKVAESATEKLRLYAPEDPTRYDFALCHLSMAGGKVLDYFARQRKKTVTHATLER